MSEKTFKRGDDFYRNVSRSPKVDAPKDLEQKVKLMIPNEAGGLKVFYGDDVASVVRQYDESSNEVVELGFNNSDVPILEEV